MQRFREKAMGDDVEQLAEVVTAEIRKEFTLLKQKSAIETRRRCEGAVKNEADELTRMIKTG